MTAKSVVLSLAVAALARLLLRYVLSDGASNEPAARMPDDNAWNAGLPLSHKSAARDSVPGHKQLYAH